MLRPWILEVQLDRNETKAVYLQIADAIIRDIQSGRLKAGTALPGSRKLAEEIKVNRNTVVDALDVLLSQGWLVSEERRGTFVAEITPGHNLTNKSNSLPEPSVNTFPKANVIFDDGHPDSKIAPIDQLARAYRQIFKRKARWKMMGYAHEFGDIDFRNSIVDMLNHKRGMYVDQSNICITRGSQMAMYLIAQCLFKKGDYVAIESPGYKSAWKVFENSDAALIPIGVDHEGLIVADLEKQLQANKKVKAVYITPHRQYPTTVTMSLHRRMELIRLANEHDLTIIEDDYDYEFHFGRRPMLPISSYSHLKKFIYVGTLSKVVAPALRIGYLISNDSGLLHKIGELRKIIDVQGDTIMEQAVLELINDGTIKRHIRKATQHYKHKRDFMVSLMEKYMDGLVDYEVPEGGLAIWITPRKKMDWTVLVGRVREKGVQIIPPEQYSYGTAVNGVRLGYGSLDNEQLEQGVKTLGKILRKLMEK